MQAIKEAGLPIGPCVPVPDQATKPERAALLSDAQAKYREAKAQPDPDPEGPICAGVLTGTLDGHEIEGIIGCGQDIQIVGAQSTQTGDGSSCIEYSFKDRADGASAPVKTKVLCEEGSGS